jgi:hypothetical protein
MRPRHEGLGLLSHRQAAPVYRKRAHLPAYRGRRTVKLRGDMRITHAKRRSLESRKLVRALRVA